MSLYEVRAQNEFLFSSLLQELFHRYSRVDFSLLRFDIIVNHRYIPYIGQQHRDNLYCDNENADLKPRFFCDGANGLVLALTRRLMNFFFCPSVIAKLNDAL